MPTLVRKLCLVCASSCFLTLLTFTSTQADSSPPQPQPPTPEILDAQALEITPDSSRSVAAAGMGCGGEELSAYEQSFEEELTYRVNQIREAEGLSPLKLNQRLTLATRYHAHDMAEDQYFDHDTHDIVNGELTVRCLWHERIRGYFPGPSRLGENIARGYTSPQDVVEAWMESEGHRKNILGNYREIGVSHYNYYWVQNFAERTEIFPVVINKDAGKTADSQVELYVYGAWDQVRVRTDDGAWSNWMTFSNRMAWEIPAAAGMHRVTVEMKSGSDVVVSEDSIEYIGEETTKELPKSVNVQPAIYLPLVLR